MASVIMSARPHRATLRKLLAVVLGLSGLALLAIGMTLWSLRADRLREAATDNASLATALAEQTARSVQSIDLVLTDIRDQVRERGVESREDFSREMSSAEINALLLERLSRLPQADFVAYTGLDGRIVNTSRQWPAPKVDLADIDYVRHFRDRRVDELFVGEPRINRLSGVGTLFFVRPIFNRVHSVIGLALVGMRIASLQALYDKMASSRRQAFGLLRDDGLILVRYPDAASFTGRRIPPGSPFYKLIATPGGGNYRVNGLADGTPRLVSTRPVRDYPLAVTVSLAESTVLATWWRRAALIGIGALLTFLCLGYLLKVQLDHFRRLADSQASLAEREARLAEKSGELEQVNLRLDAALNNMSQGLCMFDRDGRLAVCNETYLRLYSLSPQQVKPGCTLRELLEARRAVGNAGADIDAYIAELQARLAADAGCYLVTELADGRVVAVHNKRMADGGWVATHEDITARQRAEARIAHMARHDALTDLPNRATFKERLGEAVVALAAQGRGFSVFIFDLDLFKNVNDSLGHPTGDALLQAIAQRLLMLAGPEDAVARLGGDEFALLHPTSGEQKDGAIVLASRLVDVIGAPYVIDGSQIVIGISVGIALAPGDGSDATHLMKRADLALYRAKSDGRNCFRFYEPGMDEAMRLRNALEADLRGAIAKDEFVVEYQTIYDIGTREACGAEALVRWHHPDYGVIAPDRFIALAEELGLIVPLGAWVLRRACADAAAWPDRIKLAVNLSAVQFRSGNIVETVTKALADAGLPPCRLELEITESVLLEEHPGTLIMLRQLKEIGIGIALDDFGTGYSSLRYLRMFPFTKVKIDRSFVAEMALRADCAAIVCAFTNLGSSLDMVTTAEGVETEEQLDLLRAAGCREVQGFLLSRPLPAAALDFGPRPADSPAARGAA